MVVEPDDGSGLVDVVTVNWNAGDQLAACAASVATFEPDIVGRHVIVDNASTDRSLALLQPWPKLVVDETGANLGFGRACNRGARHGDAQFILMLNPDARLTGPGAIDRAVSFLRSPQGAEYGICGIMLIDDTGTPSRHCARFPTLRVFLAQALGLDRLFPSAFPGLVMTDFDHRSDRGVDHVQGSFYLIRRALFEALGGFDEDFFVYYEDLDLSLRARQHGARSFYLAGAQAYHRGGGTSQQVSAKSRFYELEARVLYARKHLGRAAFVAFLLCSYAVEPLLTLGWYSWRYGLRGVAKWGEVFGQFARATPRLLWGPLGRPASRGWPAARAASAPRNARSSG